MDLCKPGEEKLVHENEVWDEIIHQFPNFNGCTTLYNYLSSLGLKLIHVNTIATLNAEYTLGCLDHYTAPNNKYIGSPNPIQTPTLKGLPVAHPKWSHHETVALWNSLRPCGGSLCFEVTPHKWGDLNVSMFSLKKVSDGSHEIYTKTQFSIGFGIKIEIEDQCQSSPKLIGILTVLRCNFGPNLEILTSISVELSYCVDKLKTGQILRFKFNLTLKVKINC